MRGTGTVREMIARQGSTDLAARVVFGSTYGTVALVRSAIRTLRGPWVAARVLAIAAVAAVTRGMWYPRVREWAEQASPPVWDAMAGASRWVLGRFEEYGRALGVWSAARRGRPGPTLAHTVARELATSPEPITRTEIAGTLRTQVAARGHQAVMADLRAPLTSTRRSARSHVIAGSSGKKTPGWAAT